MKIAIDYSPTHKDPAGIGQYTINLISKLIEIHPEHDYILYSFKPILINKNATNIVFKKDNLPGAGFRWLKKIAKDAKRKNVDIMLSTSNFILPKLFPKTIQFIHDIAPIKYPKSVSKHFEVRYKLLIKSAIKNAWTIVTISNTAKLELLALFPNLQDNISTIFPAINKWFNNNPKNLAEVFNKYQLPQKYILALSTTQPRKNFIHILKGFFKYKESHDNDIKLVIIGKKGWKAGDVDTLLQNSKFKNDVQFLGYVPNNELSAIYFQALMFINLSYYEGFGMPVLESLYFQLPTLVSDIPVYNELFKNHVTFVDPDDTNKIAELIHTLSKQNKNNHLTLVNQFTWDKSAERLNELIETSPNPSGGGEQVTVPTLEGFREVTVKFFKQTLKNPLSIFENEFIRYLFIGGSTFILDFGIYQIFKSFLNTSEIISNVFSVLLSVLFNFSLTNFWTFKNTDSISAKKLSKYILLATFNYCFNITLFTLFTQTLHWHDLLSKVIITAIIVSWNFLIYKFWVFKD